MKSILFILSILLFVSCQEENVQEVKSKPKEQFIPPTADRPGTLTLNSKACYFDDADSMEKKLSLKLENPSNRELEQVESIMKYSLLPQNFKIYRGDIDNALATVVNRQRLIVYNKDLFRTMDDLDQSYWSSLFILAHEIGHHLANNITDTSDALRAELEADQFAGLMLANMGADSNQVLAAVKSRFISNAEDTKTHPAKHRRISFVKEAWLKAGNIRKQSAIPPPIDDAYTRSAGTSLSDGFGATSSGFDYTALLCNSESDWRYVVDKNNAPLKVLNRSGKSEGIETGSENYQGIILDVVHRPKQPNYPSILGLEIEVLITAVDARKNHAAIKVNQRKKFLVYFDSGNSWVALNPLIFFAGGRRFEFDLYDLKNPSFTSGLYLISCADAIQ
ncbi:MAG: hypothetical protein JNJ58_00595 [Chitinophagaceae bacterium]|nr:hypothetical protein [Chitinophagaceae bacterium]